MGCAAAGWSRHSRQYEPRDRRYAGADLQRAAARRADRRSLAGGCQKTATVFRVAEDTLRLDDLLDLLANHGEQPRPVAPIRLAILECVDCTGCVVSQRCISGREQKGILADEPLGGRKHLANPSQARRHRSTGDCDTRTASPVQPERFGLARSMRMPRITDVRVASPCNISSQSEEIKGRAHRLE